METTYTKDGKKITCIPQTKSLNPTRDGFKVAGKMRVAAYCRVSTALEEQQGSYALQESYFREYIKSRPDWELAGIYGDEGKSGTSMRGRRGFLAMMDDARAGKIDYIIAKASSRFGRNNAEFIQVLDELASYGIEVFFESEGIMTSQTASRSMLQFIGATNEMYSSTLSTNVRWAQERNMKNGKVTICYKTFLGYEKGADGKPQINEEEAGIVRRIYEMFLDGESYTCIAKRLTAEGIKTPGGKEEWKCGRIKSILTNEKYQGDALLQKTFTVNHLDKHGRKNNGQKPQVLVENNHPAIIDRETFAKVQELVKKRSRVNHNGTAKSPFNGKIYCEDCGSLYGHKTWNSRGNITYSVWTCNHKYSKETVNSKKCEAANLREEWIRDGHLITLNRLLVRKGEILALCARNMADIKGQIASGELDKAILAAEEELARLHYEMNMLEQQWEFSIGQNDEFAKKQQKLGRKVTAMGSKIESYKADKAKLLADLKILTKFSETLEKLEAGHKSFSAKAFTNLVEKITVTSTHITYHYFAGQKQKVDLDTLRLSCMKK